MAQSAEERPIRSLFAVSFPSVDNGLASRPRPYVSLVAALALLSAALIGAAPGRAIAGRQNAVPTLPSLTGRQIHVLSSGRPHRVIIILRSQPVAGRGAASRRAAVMAAAAESAVLNELHSVRARRAVPMHLVNAVAASVTPAEAAYLRSNPEVRAVVPDAIVRPPTLPTVGMGAPSPTLPGLNPGRYRAVRRSSLRTCDEHFVRLEPEALQLTHTAFNNPTLPQARNLATGKGVTVAFFADGVDANNPDFIRPSHDGHPGRHVFVSNLDFGGDGPNSATSGGEAFGDASSIAAQGNEVYDVNEYANASHRARTSCPMRIEGMAPGASLMGFNVFGQSFSYESNIMLAIQYAVDHGADVLSESLGFNPLPDDDIDPMSLANDQAVAHGLTVVVSTGDSGTADTVASPASDPHVIAAGASTQLRSYEQLGVGGALLGRDGYLDNNVSAFSSAGVVQSGRKAVDVLAPGDLSWALCTPKRIFASCRNLNGHPSRIELFGGTSESAPLTAGEAALVIQAYRETHSGISPSPQLVKQIITSTATDLGIPSYEQGAGLIDSLKAVQAAMSYANPSKAQGDGLLTSPGNLTAADAPGAMNTFPISVSNVGSSAQVVSPIVVTLGAPFAGSSYEVHLKSKTDPIFRDESGQRQAYAVQSFDVPTGAQRLDAAIAWKLPMSELGDKVSETLFDPNGDLAAYSFPQEFGDGYGHVDVRFPVPGKWKAVIWTDAGKNGFSGLVELNVAVSNFVPAGTVSPASLTVAPGHTMKFDVHITTPAQSGDFTGQVVINTSGSHGGPAFLGAGAIPVILRSLIPLSTGRGTFSGVFTGGNGRGETGQTLTYEFDVPPGQRDVEAAIRMSHPDNEVVGLLVSPSGFERDLQASDPNPDGKGLNPTLQLVRRDPAPGRWKLVLVVIDFFAANADTSVPFTGTITLDGARARTAGIPDGSKVTLDSGRTTPASITVTNTGNTAEAYFVDPRRPYSVSVHPPASRVIHIPNHSVVEFGVPPDASSVEVLSEAVKPSLPIDSELLDLSNDYSPDTSGVPFLDRITHYHSAYNGVWGYEVPPGQWGVDSFQLGPFTRPAAEIRVYCAVDIKYKAFDTSLISSTGDIWPREMGVSSSHPFKPLVLRPGATGTIKLSFKATWRKGSVESGTVYLDSFTAGQDSLDDHEVRSIPYMFRVK